MKNILKPWHTFSSKIVYKNSFITVIEDAVMKPDGTKGIYGYLKIPKTVGIVALDNLNRIYLCRQFRYVFQEYSWEIPRGYVEKGEISKKAAIRELLEETGLSSRNIQSVGIMRPSIGILSELTEIFLARNLIHRGLHNTDKEIDKIKKFELTDILKMIRNNEIKDGVTISALLKVMHLF